MGQHEELMQIFLEESRELIESLDQNIVAFENDPHNKPLLDDIFRAFHTLKGNAGLVGLKKFEKVAHVTEEVLTNIRDGQVEITSDLISFMLDALDRLKLLHEAVEQTNSDEVELEIVSPPESKSKSKKRVQPVNIILEDEPSIEEPEEVQPIVKENEIVSEDGSWGLFVENMESDIQAAAENKAQQQDAEPTFDELQEESLHPEAAEQSNEPKTNVPASWGKADTAIRVDVGLLDSMMNLVGELVLSRNQILQFVPQFDNSSFSATCQRLNLVTSELQEGVMKTRMQPIGNIFNRFRRVVRDVATSTGKLVNLKIEGQETELDKTILEGIRDPLTHLVRNAIDHGIEVESVRKKLGKEPAGTLILRAFHEGGQVNIEIIDDGAGMDIEKIKAKAIEKQIISPEQALHLSEKDALSLIFKAGFSTAAKVTNISGRGVGMDVVRTNIEKIGGTVELNSRLHKGSTIRIKIPLTLAIIPALILKSNEQRFAIPQINLLELVHIDEESQNQIETVGGAEIYRLRGKLLPILRLGDMLHLSNAETNDLNSTNIIVLAADNREFGLIVDEILDTEEIVVKPLSKHLKEISSFAGATVMGDGRVALILDVVGLAETAAMLFQKTDAKRENEEQQLDKSETSLQTLLLFKVAQNELFAVPLSLVSRLETFQVSAIEETGGVRVLQYRNKIMPVIQLDKLLPIGAMPDQEVISVLTFKIDNNDVGIIVSEIIDVIETNEKPDTESLHHHGILGSMILNKKVTILIDAFEIIKHKFPHWFDKKGIAPEVEYRHQRVLVVDDSNFIRSTYRTYLEPEGFTIVEAENGEQALELISADAFDYVITDIEMPQMDGLELTKNIRANKKLSDLPIIVSSSLASEDDVRRGKEAGANAYLKKIDRSSLLEALEDAAFKNN
ncbi:chemotaxis protein CheW [candidate division KSB1 bacterium]|nr:chemotaxis protein CheW [candidate division KSB1 bacterium]